MRLFWQLLVVIAVAVIGRLGRVAVDGNPWLALVIGLATGVLSVVAYGWAVRRTEHRAPVEVALRGAALALIGLGGAFGPEASVYPVAFGVLATGVFMWLAYRRGHVVPLRRFARADVAADVAATRSR